MALIQVTIAGASRATAVDFGSWLEGSLGWKCWQLIVNIWAWPGMKEWLESVGVGKHAKASQWLARELLGDLVNADLRCAAVLEMNLYALVAMTSEELGATLRDMRPCHRASVVRWIFWAIGIYDWKGARSGLQEDLASLWDDLVADHKRGFTSCSTSLQSLLDEFTKVRDELEEGLSAEEKTKDEELQKEAKQWLAARREEVAFPPPSPYPRHPSTSRVSAAAPPLPPPECTRHSLASCCLPPASPPFHLAHLLPFTSVASLSLSNPVLPRRSTKHCSCSSLPHRRRALQPQRRARIPRRRPPLQVTQSRRGLPPRRCRMVGWAIRLALEVVRLPLPPMMTQKSRHDSSPLLP